jgi:hypothetical protein
MHHQNLGKGLDPHATRLRSNQRQQLIKLSLGRYSQLVV